MFLFRTGNLSIINCELHKDNYLLVWARNYSAIMNVIIDDSIFIGSSHTYGAKIYSRGRASKMIVILRKSTFRSKFEGLRISNAVHVEITGCSFTNNKNGILISPALMVSLRDCLVHNNTKLGIWIAPIMQHEMRLKSEISKINFSNNSRALLLRFRFSCNHAFKISECSFTNLTPSRSHIVQRLQ